ncbi:glycosyltransferase [Xanthomarina gelatinilytica]|uniref:glycosyltransferase n=1 Tax=Xanthomarina gelatinilytica TaxID=1137281 RepID=UPI003AA99338
MRVLQVIDSLEVGGAEKVAINMSILLSNQRHISVSFLCLLNKAKLDDELIKNNIEILYLKRPNKFHIKSVIRLYKILNQFDIIHVHSRHVLRYVSLTHFLPSFFKTFKVVFHDHYGNIENDNRLNNYLRFCINNCKAYIGVSNNLLLWAKENNIKVPLFLLSNIILKNKIDDITIKTNTIIVVGNFRKQKNYEFLIDLLSNLPTNIKVDIYGQPVDLLYYEFILKLIHQRDLADRVQIITDVKNVLPLLNNYVMALHCAKSETGPLVCIEYLQKKLPFVMFETGEVAKQIKSITNKLLIDSFDKKQWQIQILKIISDKNYRNQVVNDMNLIYKNYYSEEKYLDKCLKIYEHILSS